MAGLLPFGEADGLWRSLVSALRSGRRGPRFKSGQPDHICPIEGNLGLCQLEKVTLYTASIPRFVPGAVRNR